MTNAWVRDIVTGEVFQALGNPVGYAGSQTEEEGAVNLDRGLRARRLTGPPASRICSPRPAAAGVGNTNYVNNYYTATAATSGTGWTIHEQRRRDRQDYHPGRAAPACSMRNYTLDAAINQLFVRFGLSPNLSDLLVNGQANLSGGDERQRGRVQRRQRHAGNAVRAVLCEVRRRRV